MGSQEVATTLAVDHYKLETLIELLIEKEIITKDEFNKVIERIVEKKYPKIENINMDEIKERMFIK